MKKLLLFAAAVVLSAACSSDNDSDGNSNNNSSKITPPAWIQGTWVDKETYDLLGYKIGYIFRIDDACLLNISNETCWKDAINLQNSSPGAPQVVVVQSVSDTQYKCSITVVSQTVYLNFQKMSTNTIKDIDTGMVYTKI